MKKCLVLALISCLPSLSIAAGGQKLAADTACARCIEAHEDYLASDVLGGRGSGTHDELVAAEYIASELEQYGIEPAGGVNGDPSAGRLGEYIQPVEFHNVPSRVGPPRTLEHIYTRNVVGILRGSDRALKQQIILLSAHLDHLGTRPEKAVNGDAIYNGADDDASGVTAVLELARALAAGPRPKRTVMFALVGSEALGGFGADYFRDHLNFPLDRVVANLEFEMIGRPDAAVAPHTLWLTGYERTNLGPELARHGARLVADPHPEKNFFQRSDNYVLARKGIIAHTVSSYGLHSDYHRPSDDLAHIDFPHMTESIASMVGPVEWLVNSDFKPQWSKEGKPLD